MASVQTPSLTFTDYLDTCPENGSYELVDGELVEMNPTRGHEDVVEFLMDAFKVEVRRLNLDYVVKQNISVRTETATGQERGRKPDLCVIEKAIWKSDPSAYAAFVAPFPLVVEVVSTNWKDDYLDKFDEYQRLGIREYWIVDDGVMASTEYLGNPKVPTVWVYCWEKGKYRGDRFTGEERIISPTFPELELNVKDMTETIADTSPRIDAGEGKLLH